MGRMLAFVYGVAGYLAFLATFLYAVGFVLNRGVPKSIDSGEVGPTGVAIAVNLGLLLVFAVQHTIMARPAFKRWWTQFISPAVERTTFVFAANASLWLLFWQWRPMPDVLWHVEAGIGRGLLFALSLAGFAMVVYASFLIDHLDLFGLRQVTLHLRRKPYTPPRFVERGLYKWIRHPIMAGFLIAFWATPTMTAGHLLFSIVTTVYVLFGIVVEERDLLRGLGDPYDAYRRRTPMLVPRPWRPKHSRTSGPVTS